MTAAQFEGMQGGAAIPTSIEQERDLFFNCNQCGIPLVVDAAAAGMTLNCQRCGQATTVPGSLSGGRQVANSGSRSEHLAELQRHLKENESQRTEINGYVKQLSIQLHRWQLRLQTLNERKAELRSEIDRLEEGNDRPTPAG